MEPKLAIADSDRRRRRVHRARCRFSRPLDGAFVEWDRRAVRDAGLHEHLPSVDTDRLGHPTKDEQITRCRAA